MKSAGLNRIFKLYFGFQDGIAISSGLIILIYIILMSPKNLIFYLLAGSLLISILFEKNIQKLLIINIIVCVLIIQIFQISEESSSFLKSFCFFLLNPFSLKTLIFSITFLGLIIGSIGLTLFGYLRKRRDKKSTHKYEYISSIINFSTIICALIYGIICTQSDHTEIFTILTKIPDGNSSAFVTNLTFLLTVYLILTIFTVIYYDIISLLLYPCVGIIIITQKIKRKLKKSTKKKSKQKIKLNNETRGI